MKYILSILKETSHFTVSFEEAGALFNEMAAVLVVVWVVVVVVVVVMVVMFNFLVPLWHHLEILGAPLQEGIDGSKSITIDSVFFVPESCVDVYTPKPNTHTRSKPLSMYVYLGWECISRCDTQCDISFVK